MEETYAMTIEIHYLAVLGLIALIGANAVLLGRTQDLRRYAKPMRNVMPVFGMIIATVLFTGVVMMAAKHLAFTVENILMIVISIALIALESKRYALLKHFDLSLPDALETYRAKAFRLLGIEAAMTFAITLWMLNA